METTNSSRPTAFLQTLFIILIVALTHLMINNHTATASAIFNSSGPTLLPSCEGSIAECDRDSEMLMESETSRRFLEQKKYITPGALKRDQPVCNGGAPGEPYTRGGQCVPQSSNPYHRSCSQYYRCRDDS